MDSDTSHCSRDSVAAMLSCVAPARLGIVPDHAYQVNVDRTAALLHATGESGVQRFVHMSTTAVYGYVPAPVSEEAPKNPTGKYAVSKWAAEELVRHDAAAYGFSAIVLRPAMIYGPGDFKFSRGLFRTSRLRFLPLPRGGDRLFDLVHVADVAQAVVAATRKPAAVSRAYNITDGEAHRVRDILSLCGEVTGQHPTVLPIPSAVLEPVRRLVV